MTMSGGSANRIQGGLQTIVVGLQLSPMKGFHQAASVIGKKLTNPLSVLQPGGESP